MTGRVHGSAVALDGAGVLIRGASGAGKSGLALELIALGAVLLADDAVDLIPKRAHIEMRCPQPIKNLIEVRGIGLLKLANCEQAKLAYIVDLDKVETERMPQKRLETILGIEIPLIYGKHNKNLGRALICLLNGAKLENG